MTSKILLKPLSKFLIIFVFLYSLKEKKNKEFGMPKDQATNPLMHCFIPNVSK
jgi:hypothetical protein